MQRSSWTLVFLLVAVALAYGQEDLCRHYTTMFGPIKCPNGSGCGQYYTYQFVKCDGHNLCEDVNPITTCSGVHNSCKGYDASEPGDNWCLSAEMKEPQARKRILELAQLNKILVPTCSGAYVPAKVAIRY
ncbi:MAG TPA: hypothetical protein VMU05_02285 [Dongiaceae bacterium]|nr:hypothetical protein [Dongiaceae bacterium]